MSLLLRNPLPLNALSIFVLLSLLVTPSLGQKNKLDVGIGVLVGPISGFTAKVRPENAPMNAFFQSFDLNLSTNLDDYGLWSTHLLNEKAVPNSPLTFYMGPGLTAGVRKKHMFGGVSSTIGLFFSKPPYEVFLQVMPRLYVRPDFDGRIEGATGIRIYF